MSGDPGEIHECPVMVDQGFTPLGQRHAQVAWAVLDALPDEPDARRLRSQLATAHIVGGLPTFLELSVDPASPGASYPDGRLPVTAIVTGIGGQPIGEILVWVNNGHLTGLEYAWVTDDPPDEWPSPDRVRATLD
jgi:hypothetical protein